jgi:hypothetical protein
VQFFPDRVRKIENHIISLAIDADRVEFFAELFEDFCQVHFTFVVWQPAHRAGMTLDKMAPTAHGKRDNSHRFRPSKLKRRAGGASAPARRR